MVPLVALQVSVGLLALLGGWQMLTGGLGLDPAWLQRTPFPDWTLPALALMLLPGAGELIAAAAVLRRHRHARPLAILSGMGLIAWILVQLAWLQVVHPVMQPAIFLVGALITVLAWSLPRTWDHRPGGTDEDRAGPRRRR
ncbi:hypothetical protein [Kocuria aegyptia]|uniref:DoxX family protein n=1 Tax=Kocuria aegyptia TaxID=330943 RepID=A0ABN2K994_9MICC